MKIYKLKYAGKAPQLSHDSLSFADEAYNFLLQNGFKNGFHRTVDNNGIKKDIWIMILARNLTKNTGRGASDAGKDWGTIFIMNDLDLKDKNNIVDFIQHELIHCFSERANTKFDDKSWNKPMTKTDNPEKNKEYYMMPDEQDAFMYEKAQKYIRMMGDTKAIQSNLATLKPSDAIEKTWYQDGKSWEKFLNTIYQMIPNEY